MSSRLRRAAARWRPPGSPSGVTTRSTLRAASPDTSGSARGAERAGGRYLDPGVAEALPHEELEPRPCSAPGVEHAVDLPLGQERVVGLARLRPVGELRQPAELLGEANRLLERAFESLLPRRHVEAGLAERIRERAEGVPIERL